MRNVAAVQVPNPFDHVQELVTRREDDPWRRSKCLSLPNVTDPHRRVSPDIR